MIFGGIHVVVKARIIFPSDILPVKYFNTGHQFVKYLVSHHKVLQRKAISATKREASVFSFLCLEDDFLRSFG